MNNSEQTPSPQEGLRVRRNSVPIPPGRNVGGREACLRFRIPCDNCWYRKEPLKCYRRDYYTRVRYEQCSNCYQSKETCATYLMEADGMVTLGEMAVGDFSGSGVVIVGRDPVKLRLVSEGAALFFCHRLLSADVSWPDKPGDDETGPEAHPQDPGPRPARYQRAGPMRWTTPVGWPPRPTQYLHDPEEAKSAFIVALEENGYPPLLIEDVRRTEFTNPPRATIANTMSYTSRRDDLVDNQREDDEQTFSPDDVHSTPVGHRLQLENDVLSPLAAASKSEGENTRIQLNALWSDIVTQSTELQLLVHRFTAAAGLESQRLQATVRLGQPEADLQWRRGLHEGRARGHILREALSVLLGTEGGVYAEEADEEME